MSDPNERAKLLAYCEEQLEETVQCLAADELGGPVRAAMDHLYAAVSALKRIEVIRDEKAPS